MAGILAKVLRHLEGQNSEVAGQKPDSIEPSQKVGALSLLLEKEVPQPGVNQPPAMLSSEAFQRQSSRAFPPFSL